jgi:polar amino acid transport system substrate-binding protein
MQHTSINLPSMALRRTTYLAILAIGIAIAVAILAGEAAAQAQEEDVDAVSPGVPLRVVTKEIEPFVFVGDDLSGFSIDLWDEIARVADLDFEFYTVESVTEQLDAVATREADAGIAAISITQEREQTVDFSYSYFDSGLGILTPNSSSLSLLHGLSSGILTAPILGLFGSLLIIIVVAGHIVWLLERKNNDDFPTGYLAGVWQGIWWAAVTVTTVGYGDKTPRAPIGRVFGLIWMFAGLLIIANFTAAVTSQLTVQQIQGTINGPNDLPGKTVVTVEGSTADDWLTAQRIQHHVVVEVDEAYNMLYSGGAQAVVYDYPVLLYRSCGQPVQ